MLNQSRIFVDEGASLVIGDNVEFVATNDHNEIIVNGEIEIGTGVDFKAGDGVYWEGISINNESLDLRISNVNFEKCYRVTGNPLSFSLDQCNFLFSALLITEADLDITNCDFNSSYARFEDARSKSGTIEIINSEFDNNHTLFTGVEIDGYPNFKILGSKIQDFYGNGVEIYNSGNGAAGVHLIKDCNILSNGIYTSGHGGVFAYSSFLELCGLNKIEGNDIGVQFVHNSSVTLVGNDQAEKVWETQQIRNSYNYAVFATYGSFPYLFHHNAVFNETWVNTLLKYQVQGEVENVDVRYNFWGDNFSPVTSFDPYQLFDWHPDIILGIIPDSDAEVLFTNSKALADSGNYIGAQQFFKQVVTQYDTTEFSVAALSELFTIEEEATNNYAALQWYYEDVYNQTANDKLKKRAGYLFNQCNIKLEKFDDAIAWYENIIQNPPSYHDSLFAIIDLEKLHLTIQSNGYKATVLASLPQYKPASKSIFIADRDYYLSLLFKDCSAPYNEEEKSIESAFIAELLPNVPNPFSSETNLNYRVLAETSIKINIYDLSGRNIKTFNEGNKGPGKYSIKLNGSDLDPGIYLCTIEQNGVQTSTIKITVLK